MKKVRIFVGILMIVSIIIGIIALKFTNKHVDRWYSWNVDITNIHSLYAETKETQTLKSLEDCLQSKKIPYSIYGKKLKTEMFSYDVSNIETVFIIKDQNLAQSFDLIDQRDLAKVSVDVNYENNKKIETVKHENVKKINDKYYCFEIKVVYVYIAFFVFYALLFILCLAYEKSHKNNHRKKNKNKKTINTTSINTIQPNPTSTQ